MMEVGCSWGMTRLVKHDLCTCYTLYYMCLITNRHNPGSGSYIVRWMQSGSSSWSGCNWGAAAEVDTIGEQSWSGYNWRAAVEVYAIGEQQLFTGYVKVMYSSYDRSLFGRSERAMILFGISAISASISAACWNSCYYASSSTSRIYNT